MSKISIICPIFNSEKYIKKMLQSITGQSYSDLEIICINDGSTDNSLDILNECAKKDNRIKVFSQENSGPAKARNVGLKNATGKYLMFCDSDDWYEPDMCQKMLKTIEEKKSDIVICNTFFEYETSEIQKTSIQQNRISDRYYNHHKSECFPVNSKIRLKTNVLLWNKIWKMDIIK